MLVFSTRLPLRDEIEYSDCAKLFIEWARQSPNYSFKNIEYNVQSKNDFDCTSDNVTFSIRYYESSQMQIVACRLINKENVFNWTSDCIFSCENGDKSLLIQLNCSRNDYNTELPQINKPYIVRMFVEKGFCKDDAGIPVVDEPLQSDGDFYQICKDVMSGNLSYSMPIVYISCDIDGKNVINSSFLAHQLSGVAHVFVENSYQTALKLREDTNGNNAYAGYIGIYFPGTRTCRRYGIEYYKDYKELTKAVIDSVWKALINCLDSTTYNWNQIIALQARQKMETWQDMSIKDRQDLKQYVDNFDQENEDLREQVASLNQQVYSLNVQLDAARAALSAASEDKCFYKMGKEPDIFRGERNDLLFSILTQVLNKYPQNSRPYVLIKTLIDANPKIGENEHAITAVRDIFSDGEKLTAAKKAKLKMLGFEIEEDGAHYKLIFHDQRYMFTVSKTPSDYRGGDNLSSEICNMLGIERKI
ncbi:MAG: hypothetical protein NC123_05235 [Butyrivibrio sp.]|nr:hypothetical protein [Butyrivibrio sp.]